MGAGLTLVVAIITLVTSVVYWVSEIHTPSGWSLVFNILIFLGLFLIFCRLFSPSNLCLVFGICLLVTGNVGSFFHTVFNVNTHVTPEWLLTSVAGVVGAISLLSYFAVRRREKRMVY
jgi:hypothetical protein